VQEQFHILQFNEFSKLGSAFRLFVQKSDKVRSTLYHFLTLSPESSNRRVRNRPEPAIIHHFMKPSQELFYSLDQPWNEFSKCWKKTRRKASEKAVHDLRVNTRRLIENLELARVLSKQNDINKLKRRLKKVLKTMGALRDLQVQLEIVADLPRSRAIVDFTRRLRRLERKEIEDIQDKLKRNQKRRLTNSFKEVRLKVATSQQDANADRARQSIRRILLTRQNEFLRAKRQFQRSQPVNEDALHEMRIALKKLRYAMEAGQFALVEPEKERMDVMRAFQKLLGDSRDLEILRAELEQWAEKKGKKIAVNPALQRLEENRKALLKKIVESSHELDNILQTKSSAPVAETTEVVKPVASTALAVKAGVSSSGTPKNLA
jgi:CHAD domain-containing protein